MLVTFLSRYNHLMNHEMDTSIQSSMPGFRCEWTLKQAAFHLPRLTEYVFFTIAFCTWVSQKFCNILEYASLYCVYHVTKAVQAVEGTFFSW